MLTAQMLKLCNEVIREHGNIPICVLTKDSNFGHVIDSVSLHTTDTPPHNTPILTIIRDSFQIDEHQLKAHPKVLYQKR